MTLQEHSESGYTFVLLLERNVSHAGFAETVTVSRTSANGYQKRVACSPAFWFWKQVLCPSQTTPLERQEREELEPRLGLMQLLLKSQHLEGERETRAAILSGSGAIGVASEGLSVLLYGDFILLRCNDLGLSCSPLFFYYQINNLANV